MALHGVERNTMDIDISVVISPENLRRLIEVARELELTPALPIPLSALAEIEQLRRPIDLADIEHLKRIESQE